MADPFIAEIRVFPYTFAPQNWAFCNGQLIPIQQNTALFSLLGTTYGGDGSTNFALPDLQGRVPMHPGQGPGLSDRILGESGGTDSVALLPSQMPNHTHTPKAQTVAAEDDNHGPTRALAQSTKAAFSNGAANTTLAPESVSAAGGGLSHNNLQPYLTLSFCIAQYGVYPPRGMNVSLREVVPEDREFLCALYASTREEELAPVPWSDAQKAAFLRSQFEAQDAHYRSSYDNATFQVIVVDGVLAGRLYLARGREEIRIVDISLLPAFRGGGIGSKLLSDIIADADRAVRIHVERWNPAQRLYARLGFRLLEDRGAYLFLERPVN